MLKIFRRNDPAVIQDAMDLTLEQFCKKYKPMTDIEVFAPVYYEIKNKEVERRKANEPVVERKDVKEKKVTFKILKKEKSTANESNIELEEEDDEDFDGLSDEERAELKMLMAAEDVDTNNVIKDGVEKELKDLNNSRKPLKVNSVKKEYTLPQDYGNKLHRGRPFSPDAEIRNRRIAELLMEHKSNGDIVKILAEEGIKAHAPQVTKVKKILKAQKLW